MADDMTASEWRDQLCWINRRIIDAERTGNTDPMFHRLDEYRACAAELREIVSEMDANDQ